MVLPQVPKDRGVFGLTRQLVDGNKFFGHQKSRKLPRRAASAVGWAASLSIPTQTVTFTKINGVTDGI